MYRKSLLMLILALLFSAFSSASAETWMLGNDGQWKELSEEARDSLIKANKLYEKGKYAKAVKNYNAFLKECDPNSHLYHQVLERQFSIAEEFIGGKTIRLLGLFKVSGRATGEKIMERVSEKSGNTLLARDAAVAVANSYEERAVSDSGYYEAAHLKWLEILETYDRDATISKAQPTGIVGKDSMLGMARCKRLAYTGPEYDIAFLTGRAFSEKGVYDNAINCYRELAAKYPDLAAQESVEEILAQIEEERAEKEYRTGLYYQKTNNMQAANVYYHMVARQWPDSKAAQSAKRRLADNLKP